MFYVIGQGAQSELKVLDRLQVQMVSYVIDIFGLIVRVVVVVLIVVSQYGCEQLGRLFSRHVFDAWTHSVGGRL
jgi:hypothetical protein